MKLLLDCVDELPPDLHGGMRHSRAVQRRAVAASASRVREREVVLRFVFGTFSQPPYS